MIQCRVFLVRLPGGAGCEEVRHWLDQSPRALPRPARGATFEVRAFWKVYKVPQLGTRRSSHPASARGRADADLKRGEVAGRCSVLATGQPETGGARGRGKAFKFPKREVWEPFKRRSGRIRAARELTRRKGHPPVLTSPNPLSTLLQRLACARLSRPCLSCPGVSATLTTTAFARSGLRWLEIGS
jgi:hypothetical protein